MFIVKNHCFFFPAGSAEESALDLQQLVSQGRRVKDKSKGEIPGEIPARDEQGLGSLQGVPSACRLDTRPQHRSSIHPAKNMGSKCPTRYIQQAETGHNSAGREGSSQLCAGAFPWWQGRGTAGEPHCFLNCCVSGAAQGLGSCKGFTASLSRGHGQQQNTTRLEAAVM